jgi:uncharacterized protein (DUF983 family)
VSFSTVCPSCGCVYRLLDKFLDFKVMCEDCDRPFRATNVNLKDLEVEDDWDLLPAEGWLVVCPACAHTEVVSRDDKPRAYCSRCDSPLAAPVTACKKIRIRKSKGSPPKP